MKLCFFPLAALVFVFSPALARAACIFQSKADVEKELSELEGEYRQLKDSASFFDNLSGCERLISQQTASKIAAIKSQILPTLNPLLFPLSEESCSVVAKHLDVLKSWIREYKTARSGDLHDYDRVCRAGVLRVERRRDYFNAQACVPVQVHPEPQMPPGFQDATQAAATQSEQGVNLKDANEKTDVKFFLQPQSNNPMNQKILDTIFSRKVNKAADSVKKNKATPLKELKDLGLLLLQSELNGLPPDEAKKWGPTILRQWSQKVQEYKRLFRRSEGKPLVERVSDLMLEVNNQYTHHYRSHEVDPEAFLMSSFLIGAEQEKAVK